tara:strand:+ start:126 stop:1730 length:1605 start_codon:yes stop_codon:yes gene_type:complete
LKANNFQTDYNLQFFKNSKLILCIIFVSSLILNLCFLPYDIPVTNDSLDYLVHAKEISNQGKLPTGNYPVNDGWPMFISFFLNFYNSENFLDDSNLQKIISTILLSLILIPIYLLCKKFIRKEIALVGASLLVFHPLLIENSFLGLTEPLFILLISIILLCMISKDIRLSLVSVFLISIASVIRYEAVILIIPFIITLFLKNKFSKKSIVIFLIGILIFTSIILPISIIRIDNIGHDGLFGNIFGSMEYFSDHVIEGVPEDDIIPGEDYTNKTGNFIQRSLQIFITSTGLILLPFFIFVIPTGLYFFFKERNVNTWILVIFAITLSLPVAYAFGRGISEPRYLFILFPILCVVSSFTLQKIQNASKSKFIILGILSCIIFSAILLVNDGKEDFLLENEGFENAKNIASIANGVNYYSQSKYIEAANLSNEWPDAPEFDAASNSPNTKTAKFSASEYNSLEKFITETREYDYENKRNGLTHLVIDRNTKDEILKDIISNEIKYSYLEKIELNFKDNTQETIVYKINFEKFDKIEN